MVKDLLEALKKINDMRDNTTDLSDGELLDVALDIAQQALTKTKGK